MKINNKSISDFVQEYKDKYVFRIRKDKTLVYYKGIQAFIIQDDGEDNININISKSTFKCNPTAIVNYEGDYKSAMISICKNLSMTMKRITFEIATSYDENKMRDCLDKFLNYCDLNFPNLINKDVILKKLNTIFDNLNKLKDQDDIKAYEEKNKIEINFNYLIKNIKDIIDLQYEFYKKMIYKDGVLVQDRIKNTTFSYSIKIKNDLTALINTVESAIDNYSGADCLEKKYQQQFMLNAYKSNIFDTNVIPFEEEYPLTNYHRKDKNTCKKGRIDTVFYSCTKDEITDIYLIELKVDEKVILGNNGVLTHLDDIQDIVDNRNGKQKKFFNDLLNNINYSNNIIDSSSKELVYSNDLKIHFYTVFGFTNKHSRTITNELISKLSSTEEINELCNNKKLPAWCYDNTITSIGKEMPTEYFIKFYSDNTDWVVDTTIGNIFTDVTKDVYK